MARLIPDSLDCMPSGEKRVCEFLQRNLPDDCTIWHEPFTQKGRNADCYVWLPDSGLFVIEIKDWSFDSIDQIDAKQVVVKGLGIKPHPLLQVKQAADFLKERLEKEPLLKNLAGKLKFPVSHCVVFTNMSEKDICQTGEKGVSIKDTFDDLEACFTSDRFFGLMSSVEEELKRSRQLEFAVSLSNTEFERLTRIMFPKYTNSHIDDDEKLYVLDSDQLNLAMSIAQGHCSLKGVAGSGKSLVVKHRAETLLRVSPQWKILVTCFNRHMARYLRNLLTEPGSSKPPGNVHVCNFHELGLGELRRIKDLDVDALDFRDGSFEAALGENVEEILEWRTPKYYDAILIDEGQDFKPDWIRFLVRLLNPKTNSLLFCHDPTQSIFGTRKATFKNMNLNVPPARSKKLTRNYRNTVEIGKFAKEFINTNSGLASVIDLSESEDLPLAPEFGSRHGEYPMLKQIDIDDEIDFVAGHIRKLNITGVPFKEICILFPTLEYGKFVYNGLLNAMGEDQLDCPLRGTNINYQSNQVRLLTMQSVKGLDFRAVIIVGLQELPFSQNANVLSEEERSLLYVAFTRARRTLIMTYRHRNITIDMVSNALMRCTG